MKERRGGECGRAAKEEGREGGKEGRRKEGEITIEA